MSQKIINIGTIASSITAILCLYGVFYTSWSFSTVFKTFFCSSALFLALLFVTNWKYNRLAIVFAVASFVLTCISIISVDLFAILKTTVFTCLSSLLAGSIIGYFQNHAISKIIQLVGTVSVILSLAVIILLIWQTNVSTLIYTSGLFALEVVTIALFINMILLLLKK